MAKDAFALSPITARAVQPSEEDYEAISEAFMETARGRWFLGEYAKRNRNADTRMVLDAVERIEQSLTSQKQQDTDNKLAAALTAIKAVIEEARNAASAAIDAMALEESVAPVRKGARIMKEISWRWREIGADGRICDLIDQQVAAIEASCDQIGAIDPRTALSAAFELITLRLAQFDQRDDAPVDRAAAREPAARAAPAPSPSSIIADEVTQAAAEKTESPATKTAPETSIKTAEAIAESAAPIAGIAETARPEIAAAEALEPVAEGASEAPFESTEMSAEAADAHDEAVLDLIAMEMAVVDSVDDEEAQEGQIAATATPHPETTAAAAKMVAPESELPAVEETAPATSSIKATPPSRIEQLAPTLQETIARAMEPAPLQPVMEMVAERPSMPRTQPSTESLAQAILEASPEPSLGSVVIASGIIRKPISASDPLASLRRLTQAEKVALFS
jgi:hypothetical protein